MRRILFACALAACGGSNNPAKEDAPVVPADVGIDAPIAPPSCASPTNGTTVSVRRVGTNLTVNDAALLVTAPAGDPRLFVVVRNGEIRIIENEQLVPTPFIDLGSVVAASNESGLLGLAFHPQYHLNGQFFVYYRRAEPAPNGGVFTSRNVVARCGVSADPYVANSTCVEILQIRDRFANHNGGMIEFGPDGKLYIGTGDGGSGGDPDGNAQTLTDGQPVANSVALMGKMLRIDVDNKDSGKEYGVPADNPFLASGAPEVFALGLRNPWRFSFDSATGDMWIGDVGQGGPGNPTGTEEINFVPAGELSGKNFGWDMWEGSVTCFTGPCSVTGITFPVDERSGGNGFSAIVGGQVYRGTCYPDLVGTYFYTDNSRGGLYTLKREANGTFTRTDLTPPAGTSFPTAPSSIHAAADGELYITRANNTSAGGEVFRIEAGP